METEPLPLTGVSSILGLLEVLDDHEGKDDIYKLARHLNYELDDLLPITDAAEYLRFVVVDKGDIFLTEKGKEILKSDVNNKKKIFKEQIKNLPVFKEVISSLKRKKDHHIKRDLFLRNLEKKFSPDRSQEILKGTIEWGRYAELIGYNPESEELYLDME